MPGNEGNTLGSKSRKSRVWEWEVLGKCKEPNSEKMWKSGIVTPEEPTEWRCRNKKEKGMEGIIVVVLVSVG
jgi:hypothetical protein